MKTTFSLLFGICFLAVLAQESGNANYGNNSYSVNQASVYQTAFGNRNEMTITIKGIYNEKATSKLAVFSVLQLGKTAEEATGLIDERIGNVKFGLKAFKSDIEVVTDMISFVPVYAFEEEKRIFNPKTYNEKPSGFELRKNLIIKFKETDDLSQILKICAGQEIYDLAKVDYVSVNHEKIWEEIQTKAMTEFGILLSNYSEVMNVDLTQKEKILQEGYNIIYPMESYRNYQAYSQASLNPGKGETVNRVTKNTTQYYNAVLPKPHAFVMNPDITEPTMQYIYELTVKIQLKEDLLPKNTIQKNNKYFLVTPNGDLKTLDLN
ncbi:MAG: SIMPL domain-containing protein [Weeksellaceae bacterium]